MNHAPNIAPKVITNKKKTGRNEAITVAQMGEHVKKRVYVTELPRFLVRKHTLHDISMRLTATMGSETRLVTRRLPVPSLRQTLDKYLKSLVPFLREEKAQGGGSYDAEMDKQVKLAREFEHGIGSVLQKRLLGESNYPPYRLPSLIRYYLRCSSRQNFTI